MANKTVVEFLEEWQTGFLIIIGCFSGGIAGLYLFVGLDLFAGLVWNIVMGFVLGVGFAFLIVSYVLYSN